MNTTEARHDAELTNITAVVVCANHRNVDDSPCRVWDIYLVFWLWKCLSVYFHLFKCSTHSLMLYFTSIIYASIFASQIEISTIWFQMNTKRNRTICTILSLKPKSSHHITKWLLLLQKAPWASRQPSHVGMSRIHGCSAMCFGVVFFTSHCSAPPLMCLFSWAPVLVFMVSFSILLHL